ncbi:hypothetical protein BR93DRAFT_312671 [Coniochaeta sp. PMI_546]|nr:hypothetical protein BR93DRAFT_312671 [Coniochaeta sp. PMI_546]
MITRDKQTEAAKRRVHWGFMMFASCPCTLSKVPWYTCRYQDSPGLPEDLPGLIFRGFGCKVCSVRPPCE